MNATILIDKIIYEPGFIIAGFYWICILLCALAFVIAQLDEPEEDDDELE